MKAARPVLILSSYLVLVFALSFDTPAVARGGGRAQFGKALDGLNMDERKVFRDAKEEFEAAEDAGGGLGPIFNEVSCVACHSVPAVGGSSPISEPRAQRVDGGTHFEFPGGSLFQVNAIRPDCQEVIPSDANARTLRQTTPLFGSGLIEAIPDFQIEAYRALQHRTHPAQEGRVHRVVDVASAATRVGRFGWKAQQATLLAFSADAYVNEMGITSRLFPNENAPNGDRVKLAACDSVADPEDTEDDIVAFADFMRMLAPPPRDYQWERDRDDDQAYDRWRHASGGQGRGQNGPRRREPSQLQRGEMIFESVGCAVCHRAGYTTSTRIAALDRQRVDAYSDFLLHDVGTGDGIIQGDALGNELRTAPLWGISESAPYLHDGSASTIESAIEHHGNQAAAAREAYGRLSRAESEAVLAFLDSI